MLCFAGFCSALTDWLPCWSLKTVELDSWLPLQVGGHQNLKALWLKAERNASITHLPNVSQIKIEMLKMQGFYFHRRSKTDRYFFPGPFRFGLQMSAACRQIKTLVSCLPLMVRFLQIFSDKKGPWSVFFFDQFSKGLSENSLFLCWFTWHLSPG